MLRLGKEPPAEPPSYVRPPRRLHGLAMLGMAISALTALGSMIAFITVRWPGSSGRVVMGIFLFSLLALAACMSTAIFTAARDTYVRAAPPPGEERPH